ncbi:MAG: 4Fe-4S binding protein [Sediminibacterium sp.]|nr:4Fe-4S binding protein [Sediminibacterium sp.]
MHLVQNYLKNIFSGIKSLLKGLHLTFHYLISPKEIITEQYPNKPNHTMAEKFRGEVVLTHDQNNEHACTGCTSCELACPNGTIKIITKMEINEQGKKKKALDTFVYHLEMCTMCGLCVEACPTDAIFMKNSFEHSVFDRNRLIKKLNKPDSKIRVGVE